MSTNLVVFRADGGPTIGGGHIARCLALADELKKRGWTCAFAVSPETKATMQNLAASGYETLALPTTGPGMESAAIAAQWTNAAMVVVDHYKRDSMFETPARRWAEKVVVIDDLADRRHDCDLLTDPTLGRKPERYGGGAVPEGCLFLLGPNYAVLKPGFAVARAGSLERRADPKLRRLLISFGSTDPIDATGACLYALERSSLDLEIDVVLGSAAPNLEQVRTRAAGLKRVKLHIETDAMPQLMADADCALGGAGSTSWERCCMGLPALAAILADNQIGIAAGLAAKGAAQIAGPWKPNLALMIIRRLEGLDSRQLAQMSKAAAAICDGLGTMRVADAVEKLRPRRT
ncbi:MAG TPA: UDP-2,4-diacetamido-2,4,6-trideoxy-beta-L-altropyranose hydrolase [Magnetospirillaceae bacterium]